MSEVFQVPEPSERAIKAVEFHPAEKNDRLTQSDRATILHAGYHVDVPAIVRAEVERALKAYEDFALNVVIGNVPRQLLRERNFVGEWCATHFPEAAPELKEGPLGERWPVNKVWPETKQEGHHLGCCLDTDHKGPCRVVMGEPHRVYPRAMTDRAEVPFLQGDRATLAKLERFVAALARIYEVANPGDSRVTNVRAAAREYLRP